MHVGVDARCLIAPTTGIGRYLLESSKALFTLGARLTYFWPQARPDRHRNLDYISHVESIFPGALGRIVWSHSVLPVAVRRDRPDVFWGPAHRLPPFLPSTLPSAVTIHDLVWHRHPETMRMRGWLADRLMMGPAVRRAGRVIAVSSATAADVKQVFGELRNPVEVVRPGVAAPAGATEISLSKFDIDRPYMLFVGTLEPRKNLQRLVAAFSRALNASRQDYLLVVAGGRGWRDAAVREALGDPALKGNIRVIGYVDDAELAGLCARARFLAMPSLYEGFGLPALEAQRFGTPVLTSTAGALPETVGAGGLLADPYDVDAIASGIRSLFEDDDLHQQLSLEAKKNASTLSWERSAAQLLQVFEDMMREGYKS